MTSAKLLTRSSGRTCGVAERVGPTAVARALDAGRPSGPAVLVVGQVAGGMEQDSDEALVARAASGDHDAFRRLVARHMDRSLRLAQRISGNRSDAEEIAQEAFLRLWTKADTWQPGRGKFTTWFFRIVINLCLDRKRRAEPLPLESAGDPADPGRSAVAKIYQDEVGREVAQAIAALPDRQRVALMLCYYEEMSNLEAAAALRVSVSALEALLVRARRNLKIKLAPLGALGPKEEE